MSEHDWQIDEDDDWTSMPGCGVCGDPAQYIKVSGRYSFGVAWTACEVCHPDFETLLRAKQARKREYKIEQQRASMIAARERLNRVKAHRRMFDQCVDCGGVPELNREQCARCRMTIEEETLCRNPQ